VLTDPIKRKQYDSYRENNGNRPTGTQPNSDFNYSQEDILRDLFKDPHFQQMFSSLLREFQRSGLRSGSAFIKRSFWGGKGGFFISGLFFLGSLAGPQLLEAARKRLLGSSSLLKSIGSTFGSFVNSGLTILSGGQEKKPAPKIDIANLNTTYDTPLTADELLRGKTIQVLVHGESGDQTLQVKIPAGSRSGQKLRLRGRGRSSHLGKGDLFLHLIKKDR
jgi:curved DNA-binding protein